MDYLEIERTLEALKAAVYLARLTDGDDGKTNLYGEAISNINTEFERLRDLLGY